MTPVIAGNLLKEKCRSGGHGGQQMLIPRTEEQLVPVDVEVGAAKQD